MNILVLTPWFPNHPEDQQGNFILDSVDSLCALGHRVHVLVTRPFKPSLRFGLNPNGCAAIRPEMAERGFTLSCTEYLSIPRNHLRFVSNRLYLAGCSEAVRRVIATQSVDAIHAHTESAGTLACAVASEFGLPVATTLHGVNRSRRYLEGRGQPEYLRRAYSCPQRLVLVGEPLRNHVAAYLGSLDHVRVVHNGFREAAARKWHDRIVLANPRKIRFISVSNLVEGKGLEINLAAMGNCGSAKQGGWEYHVVGDGPLRSRLEAQARELHIHDKVTFHGKCNHDEVFRHLSESDVFCLPSSPEAFGVAYLEAMACGLLAVGVRGQGPSAFIRDGDTGLLVEPESVESLTECLDRIFSRPEEMQAVAARGRDLVWREFTWARHAEKLSSVLGELVGAGA